MTQYKTILWGAALAVLLSGCTSIEQTLHELRYGKSNAGFKGASVIVESPDVAYGGRGELPYGMNPVEALANENVIVYPVDEPIDANKREFPEYRGVMDNTTAGGYTVFDPSVTVYAVEGGGASRPDYLPEYSVPKYAEQYKQQYSQYNNATQSPMPVQNVTSLRAQPLMPMHDNALSHTPSYGGEIVSKPLSGRVSMAPRGPRVSAKAGKVSRPWLEKGNNDAALNASGSSLPASRQAQPQARRSSPMLTGY